MTRVSTTPNFRDLDVATFYSATGRTIFEEVVYPIIRNSKSYDRLTGYFGVDALVSAAFGLEGLFRRGGKMRLVVGIHDLSEELIAALAVGNVLPDEIVEDYKSRLLSEVGFLTDRTKTASLVMVGWMMRTGLLEVKVAAPRNARGIFHQKRMIFRDDDGNVIAGTGSLNETPGSQENIEEMHFSFSWPDDGRQVRPFIDSFEAIWSGSEPNIEIFDLDPSFATRILSNLGDPVNPLAEEVEDEELELRNLLEIARNSPSFTPFNISSAALFPHQERVFVESLSRWPIRVLLADEVGLGKTLEAGSIVSYLLKFANLKSVTILAPASLLRQWQEEMTQHFSLGFWRWDSSQRGFISPSGEFSGVPFNSPTGPSLRLVSAQWARVNKASFLAAKCDLVLVDEAHSARLTVDNYGTRTTKIWDLIHEITKVIPHLVLMTATPMQVQPAEYHGLLRLLGLDETWGDFERYEKSLSIISGQVTSPSMQDGLVLGQLIVSSYATYDWFPEVANEEDQELLNRLRQLGAESRVSMSIEVQRNFDLYRKLLQKIHPAHLLTCRNTKSGLEKFGYRFPVREFESPEVFMTGRLAEFERAVEIYLTDGYGAVEASLNPEGKSSVGFAKSGYYQRIVSSFYGAKRSLEKRKHKVEMLLAELEKGDLSALSSFYEGQASFDEDEDDDFSQGDNVRIDIDDLARIIDKVRVAVKLESSFINDVLGILLSAGDDVISSDPKFAAAIRALEEKTTDSQVLIFSRYTDTLEGFLSLFESSPLASKVSGYAMYTGGSVWIQSGGFRRDSDKKGVTDALRSGAIQVVFCSDAASEGLNLQSARCLMNLDVPWNPARLEQRIGRIARLGQTASSVSIINFWYPKSIEAKMYARLLSRRDVYQLAVGEFPEIFSDAIRREVSATFGGAHEIPGDPISELQMMRSDMQRVALEAVWGQSSASIPPSDVFRLDLAEFLGHCQSMDSESAFKNRFAVNAGEKGALTLMHPVLDEAVVAVKGIIGAGLGATIWAIEDDQNVYGLAIELSDDKFWMVGAGSFGKVLLGAVSYVEFPKDDRSGFIFSNSNLAEAVNILLAKNPWIPKHWKAQMVSDALAANPPTINNDKLTMKKLGRLQGGGE